MQNQDRIWALLINLGIWEPFEKLTDELKFDQDVWDFIVDESAKAGFNTLIIDVGSAIVFPSHPELALKGAWTRKKLRQEMKKCRDKGLRLIPKLNFSATHDVWLGEYGRMLSTNIYYKVCNDMIKDAYELFDHPEYIHIGMDEEGPEYAVHEKNKVAMFRTGELLYHDIRFFVDCVEDAGAKAWMWRKVLYDNPEMYKKWFDADDILLSPFNYNAVKKEHWTPVSSRQAYIDYYSQDKYKDMNIEYVEQDPIIQDFFEKTIPLMKKEGYKYVPNASLVNKCEYCIPDMMEYFKEEAPPDQVLGFMITVWHHVTAEFKDNYAKSIQAFKESKERIYG